uniref:Variant surface glycoprotein 1125.1233 n=1 Tax=Trypanosoma brucei TaxID=5691 RepID=A0A1J0R6H3_9TRYP|nr:variant surface glycoprotein 1125.1233 [Trypanosoma brucei]
MLKAIAAIFLFSEVLEFTDAAKGDGLIEASWTKVCGLVTDLDKVPNSAWHKVDQLSSLATRLEQTALRCGIFALATGSDQDRQRAAILQTVFNTKAQKARTQLADETEATAIKATKAAAYTQGRLTEFLQIAAQTQDSTEGCLLTGSNAGVAPTATLTGAHGTTCSLEYADPLKHAAPTPTLTETGFTTFLTPGSGSDTHQTQASKECSLFTIHATGLATAGAVSAANVQYAAGLINIDKAGSSALTVTDLNAVASDGAGNKRHWNRVYKTIKQLQDSDPLVHENKTLTKTDNDLQMATLTTGLHKEDATGLNLENEVTKIFTSDVGSTVAATLAKVYSLSIAIPINNGGKQQKLHEIAATSKLHEILVFYTQQTADKLAKVTKDLEAERHKTATSGLGETECNKIKIEADCNKTAACSFNNTETDETKSCKFDAKKALKSGVPVTETQT